jgi:transcriptional regulator with XRE-family HTH domain
MSTTATPSSTSSAGFPELTPLGKQLEVLRIGRGISKQHLARFAGTSRQQLWRVMTGKSELTDTLRQRLAQILAVDPGALVLNRSGSAVHATPSSLAAGAESSGTPLSVDEYFGIPDHAERTLRTLPNGDDGRELKRTLLNALEDQAFRRGITLTAEFFELRRRVLAGQL